MDDFMDRRDDGDAQKLDECNGICKYAGLQ